MEYRITELIEERGLTVSDFVEKMGWKQRSSFYNLMSGNPTIQILEKMACVLECKVSDLLKENDIVQTKASTPTYTCPHCGKPLDVKIEVN